MRAWFELVSRRVTQQQAHDCVEKLLLREAQKTPTHIENNHKYVVGIWFRVLHLLLTTNYSNSRSTNTTMIKASPSNLNVDNRKLNKHHNCGSSSYSLLLISSFLFLSVDFTKSVSRMRSSLQYNHFVHMQSVQKQLLQFWEC